LIQPWALIYYEASAPLVADYLMTATVLLMALIEAALDCQYPLVHKDQQNHH
jgi:hypothetical protein